MPRFAIRNPYFIIVIFLIVSIVGTVSVVRMPVDLFPTMNIPVVVVATFYAGMPPEQIEADITSRYERFFTLGSGIEHIESRSITGVSLIKIFFQPGTNADAATSMISNLAMANLRRLPPGTLPPLVLKFDASSLPVCLVTLKGEGMTETTLRDIGQYNVRNQIATVPGASLPQPFGGRFRQIMIYVDPQKLEGYQMSPMDVVRAVNDSNLILPSGDIRIGPLDYTIATNSLLRDIDDINAVPIKVVGDASVRVSDVGEAKDAEQIQYNIVRVDGQRSVYLPVLRQGGDTNTIAIVEGIRAAIQTLTDIPKQLQLSVVFDQAKFVKAAIETLLHEGAIGLLLTSLMILIFLGSMRATVAVFLSIPLSALAAFLALYFGGSSINTMILGGLALAFSRLIDNSVVVLENIFRRLELGDAPETAAEKGGAEVAIPVLAATITTAVVFFPVTFLYGVSKFLFSALALAVVLSLFASYFVAMTVVPLFCAKLIRSHGQSTSATWGARFNRWFNRRFEGMLNAYSWLLSKSLRAPVFVAAGLLAVFASSLTLFPLLGLSFFPRTDAGQFLINVKAPSGTRIELTEQQVQKLEDIVREVVKPEDLDMIVDNIGITPELSAVWSSNAAQHTAFVQVSLKDGHRTGSYEYMDAVRRRLERDMPNLTTYFQSGGLVDAVLNLGLPAPIDIQISGTNLKGNFASATRIAARVRNLPGVGDVLIPQDLDYPSIQVDIDRTRAGGLGLNQREVISNVITALSSNQMIAPSYWVDPKSGVDYLLTVQYPESQVKSILDLGSIPLRAANRQDPTQLGAVTNMSRKESPTEVDHYQIRRVIDLYVRPAGEDLGKLAASVESIIASEKLPEGSRVTLRGMVQGMRSSFQSFGTGLILAVVLLYLVLVAQFQSFLDPLIILLAVPMGLIGVMLTLYFSGTTLNVMSLMGIVMMVGIVVSNSILIVEFTRRLREDGMPVREAISNACRVRLRPVLMTSLATVIGLVPMALKFGTGSESYAPLAQCIIGGLSSSVLLTVFIVPAAYVLAYDRKGQQVR